MICASHKCSVAPSLLGHLDAWLVPGVSLLVAGTEHRQMAPAFSTYQFIAAAVIDFKLHLIGGKHEIRT